MSLANLKTAMRDRDITCGQVASLLGMTDRNVSLKVNERIPMTVAEIKSIRDTFFPDMPLDYLCESDGDVATVRDAARAAVESVAEAMRHEGATEAECDRMVGELHGLIDASAKFD